MSNSEQKMKTVCLNGVAVGQVPAMGSVEKNLEAAQQFLKDKGKLRTCRLDVNDLAGYSRSR